MGFVKKAGISTLVILTILYAGLCAWFYFYQEKQLFKTIKHPASHQYVFTEKFEERNIIAEDGKKINGILFKADLSKGLILWMPGGRGLLDSIGKNAKYYTDLQYDIFMMNYRGFGKSEGKISSETQFYSDMQSVYEHFKSEYSENRLVVFGYSLGTGPAARLASANNPKLLILLAPYYNLTEMVNEHMSFLPLSLLLKYKFNTAQYLKETKSPVVILHGDAGDKINISHSLRLKEFLKPADELIVLKNQTHQNFIRNNIYIEELKRVLN